MKRLRLLLVPLVIGAGLVVGVQAATAHQCPEDGDPYSEECEDTPVVDDWRPNYVPLFDLPDRDQQGEGTDGEQQRKDAQRWRHECTKANGDHRQMCQWADGGLSVDPNPDHDGDDGRPAPNEFHVGFAATHCFLFETQHQCDDHGGDHGEGVHDAHGGAIYADICLSENPESTWCDDGVEDTQAGVTIVDHLTCPMGCFDEYHVIRPLDVDYTTDQMGDSVTATERIAQDPYAHACGYRTACP